jgi:putative ABC transport system permease protein
LVVAVIALAIGLAAWAYPSRNILIGYLSLAGVLVGTAALIPIVLALVGAAAPLLPAGVMTVKSALRAIARSLSRLGPATAALVLAVATAVSIEVMVDSFRSAVSRWLSGSLGADVYVFQPGGLAMAGDRPLDRALIERISEVEGVDRLTTNRIRDLESGAGRLRVSAIAIDESDLSRFQVVDGAPAADWQAFTDATTPGVMITRPLAKHHALAPGDQLTLPTASGPQVFPVLTVLEDYASDRGIAYIHGSVYRRLWQDDRSTGLGLYGNDPADAALLAEQVRAALPSEALVTVATADELRQQSLAIFDRTFAITGILHLMASAVAVIAVISSVGVWQLERRGEWALARAMGLSAVAVRRRILTEVAVLGSITAALALPVGILLAALLISVVNERSFGWTFDLVVPLSALWHGALVAILAALVGGLLPAWQAARRSPARDLAEQEL